MVTFSVSDFKHPPLYLHTSIFQDLNPTHALEMVVFWISTVFVVQSFPIFAHILVL